jgi:M-phase inducer tyrosine phosphatase
MTSPRSTFSSGSDAGMDIDSPKPTSRRPSSVMPSPAFSGSASFSGSPGLGSFFCESPAAPAAQPTKRRSLISGSPSSPSESPSAKRASYGLASRNIEKTASSSGMLFGNGIAAGPRASTLASRRGQPYKRPTLMPLPYPNAESSTSQRTISAASAYPILYGPPRLPTTLLQKPPAAPPMRRAFSVCDQPPTPEHEDTESSDFEDSPSMNGVHAEYARRQGKKFVPRVDGSPGFKAKPIRCSIAVSGQGSSEATPEGSGLGKGKKGKISPYGPGGLPGFGDNEMDGKILPCHKVKEDGLMRITAETVS